MGCQVEYNPRFLKHFGETGVYKRSNFNIMQSMTDLLDGEGCERFWSYMNKFVPMTRSMLASNRRLLVTDAVSYFKEDKMIALREYIYIKRRHIESLFTALKSQPNQKKVYKNQRKLGKNPAATFKLERIVSSMGSYPGGLFKEHYRQISKTNEQRFNKTYKQPGSRKKMVSL